MNETHSGHILCLFLKFDLLEVLLVERCREVSMRNVEVSLASTSTVWPGSGLTHAHKHTHRQKRSRLCVKVANSYIYIHSIHTKAEIHPCSVSTYNILVSNTNATAPTSRLKSDELRLSKLSNI